jgi:hypothetical protein
MVAMPAVDLIVAAVWVGGLTLLLLGQAVIGWLKLQYARRSAEHASRLFEATRAIPRKRPVPSSIPEALPQRSGASAAGAHRT